MLVAVFIVAAAALLGAFYGLRLCVQKPQDAWMVFLGSGGHTGEMLRILGALKTKPTKLVVILGDGDKMSLAKAKNLKAPIYAVPRARRVGQSWASTIFSSAYSLVTSLRYVAYTNPRLLLVNGPGTCVILAMCVLILRPFGLKTKIVYVESLARVSSLSLSGKLLYPVADAFIVQWPQLVNKYTRARYIGLLV